MDKSDKCVFTGDCLPKLADLAARMKNVEEDVRALFKKLDDNNAANVIKQERIIATLQTIREERAVEQGAMKALKATAGVIAFLVSAGVSLVGVLLRKA